jgi:hypothetical protein
VRLGDGAKNSTAGNTKVRARREKGNFVELALACYLISAAADLSSPHSCPSGHPAWMCISSVSFRVLRKWPSSIFN